VEDTEGNVTLQKFSYCNAKFGQFPFFMPQSWENSDFDRELGAGIVILFKQYMNFILLLLVATLISLPTAIMFFKYKSDSNVDVELVATTPIDEFQNVIFEFLYTFSMGHMGDIEGKSPDEVIQRRKLMYVPLATDFFVFIIFTMNIAWVWRAIRREAERIDAEHIQLTDFAVQIANLPPKKEYGSID
jgi:hypothetical protein